MSFHVDSMTGDGNGYVFLFYNSEILKYIRLVFKQKFLGKCLLQLSDI